MPKLMKFEVLEGDHTVAAPNASRKGPQTKTIKKGGIVESYKNLDKVFVNKFKRRHDLENASQSSPEISFGAKPKSIPQDLRNEKEAAEEDGDEKADPEAADLRSVNATDPETENEAVPEDVSADFAKEIGKNKIRVTRNGDGEFSLYEGKSTKPLNAEKIGTKAGVKSFIKKYLD